MLKKLSMGVAIAAALSLSAATAQAQTVLRLATQVAPPHPFLDMAEHFKSDVERRTDGEVQVRIFPNASLGNDDAVLNEMKLGTIDLIVSSTNNAARQLPEFQILDLYYIFPDNDDFIRATASDSPLVARLQEIAEERQTGFRILALFGSGTRNLSTASGPVEHLDDVQGIKMRVPPAAIVSRSWEALGTLPVNVAWPELYAAMQTGVADALESTISGYMGSKLYEVAPHLALTAHSINGSHLSISARAWDRLTPEQQEIIQDAAAEAGQLGTQKGIEADEQLVQVLEDEHGVTVTRPDLAPFVAAIEPLHDDFAEQLGASDLLEAVREILAGS